MYMHIYTGIHMYMPQKPICTCTCYMCIETCQHIMRNPLGSYIEGRPCLRSFARRRSRGMHPFRKAPAGASSKKRDVWSHQFEASLFQVLDLFGGPSIGARSLDSLNQTERLAMPWGYGSPSWDSLHTQSGVIMLKGSPDSGGT